MVVGRWLDGMIMEVFSNLGDSMILFLLKKKKKKVGGALGYLSTLHF